MKMAHNGFLSLLVVIGLLSVLLSAPVLSQAQGGADGWTTYQLNLRSGPGAQYGVITVLAPNTGLIFEAHNADLTWLLGHTEDGAFRGWVSCLYISYREGFAAVRLPASEEIVGIPETPASSSPATSPNTSTDSAQTLLSIPVIPSISNHAREIFQGSGNDPHTLIVVGDCNSNYWEFLGPLDTRNYDLGPYSALQPTVDFFKGTWGVKGITSHGGFTVYATLDDTWARNFPQCQWGESPLSCELRVRRPAVAVMMFGPTDVFNFTVEQFESALRQVIATTVANGTIPVLTTFTWCRTGDYNEKGLQFNLAAVRVAQEYDIPLVNFWRAAQSLPNCGLSDEAHLSNPVTTTTAYFNGEEQRTGQTLHNLLILQTLDALRAGSLQ